MAKKKAKRTRRTLTEAQKAFVVQRLACYETPTDVAKALKEEYDFDLAPSNVLHYDPSKYSGKSLAKKWVELFESTRKAFLKHMDKYAPLANKAVRVQKLSKAAAAFERAGNYNGMADMLERIAKEVGNVHTNRRELTGKDGGPMETKDVTRMTIEEVDAELRQYGVDPDVHRAPQATQ